MLSAQGLQMPVLPDASGCGVGQPLGAQVTLLPPWALEQEPSPRAARRSVTLASCSAPARPHRHTPQPGAPQRGHPARARVRQRLRQGRSLGRGAQRCAVGSDQGLRAAPGTQAGSRDVTTVVTAYGSHPGTLQARPSRPGTVRSPRGRAVRLPWLRVQSGRSVSKGGSGGPRLAAHAPPCGEAVSTGASWRLTQAFRTRWLRVGLRSCRCPRQSVGSLSGAAHGRPLGAGFGAHEAPRRTASVLGGGALGSRVVCLPRRAALCLPSALRLPRLYGLPFPGDLKFLSFYCAYFLVNTKFFVDCRR